MYETKGAVLKNFQVIFKQVLCSNVEKNHRIPSSILTVCEVIVIMYETTDTETT
jgi:hypothetical protein